MVCPYIASYLSYDLKSQDTYAYVLGLQAGDCHAVFVSQPFIVHYVKLRPKIARIITGSFQHGLVVEVATSGKRLVGLDA